MHRLHRPPSVGAQYHDAVVVLRQEKGLKACLSLSLLDTDIKHDDRTHFLYLILFLLIRVPINSPQYDVSTTEGSHYYIPTTVSPHLPFNRADNDVYQCHTVQDVRSVQESGCLVLAPQMGIA